MPLARQPIRADRADFGHREDRYFGAPRVLHYEVPVPGLDPAHDGLRIAHVTDIHVGALTPSKKIARAFALADDASPDLILMTGDFLCYSKKHVPRLGELTRALRTPTVAVLGNHDYWTDGEGAHRALAKNGIDVLHNQHTVLRPRGVPLTLIGVDDTITGKADVHRAHNGVRKTGSRIVLTHVPSEADQISQYGDSLILAGHTHGGHIDIPRVTRALWQRLGWRYLEGFYRVGKSLLYVNRGVGSSSVPLRAGAPSEVAILTLRALPASET